MKIKSSLQKRICPICGQIYHEPPALSRADGETQICPDCGTREALQSIGVCNEEQEKIIKISMFYDVKNEEVQYGRIL